MVATQLGSGQYDNETTSGDWGWSSAEWRANPTLKADLVVTYADGTEQVVKSDDTWKTSDAGPIRYDNHYLGETYDARQRDRRLERARLRRVELGERAHGARPGRHADRAEPRAHVADRATIPAGTRTEPRPGVHLWNTGQQYAGWATITVSGAPAGTPIQIRYAEKLGTDGLVSITGYAPGGQIQTDYFISKGPAGADVHAALHLQGLPVGPAQRGRRHGAAGGRHGQRRVRAGDPRADGADRRLQHLERPREPDRAQHPLLGGRELRVSGVITDTPTYEKNGWAGDAQLSAPIASLQFDTERHFEKSSLDMVDDQRASGEVPLVSPGTQNYGYEGGPAFKPANAAATPIWDAYWFVVPWEGYLRYGDKESLARTYPGMRQYLLNWLTRWFSSDGDQYAYTLNSGLGDWCVPTGADAPLGAGTRFTTPTIIAPSSTAYVAYMAKIAADSARALGKDASRARRALQQRQGRLQRQVVGRRPSATTARTRRSRWCSRCRSCRWRSGSCRRSGGARCRRSSSTTCWSPARGIR